MAAAAHTPEPPRSPDAVSDADGLEPSPEWVGDELAATRFGSPEEIRAALPAEQVNEFDTAFDSALTAARKTLHLDQLRHVLRVWRRQALTTEQDPDGHRQMLVAAAKIQQTGEPQPGSTSWPKLKAELGL